MAPTVDSSAERMQILGHRSPSGPPGITPAEIASAVEQIIAAVADEYGLVEARDAVSLRSRLHDDLGMDEVDLIEVMFRAEVPDNRIGPIVHC